eukprot:g4164.t1
MSTSRMPAVGSACLRHASCTLARTVLPLPPRATPAARTAATAATATVVAASRRAHPARSVQHQPSANKGKGWSFPEGTAGAAAAAAAAAAGVTAAGALVASPSFRGDGDTPAFAAGAYSIPIGRASPDVCNCFIEVSRESRMKYEWDEETNMLKLDRVLHGAAFYPHDYGFIPQTLCGDGDPLDVLVLGTSALQPGSIVEIRALGYMVMEDEKGLDEKVLAVPDKDPRFNHMKSLRDVPEHVLREITNFFETYKQLEKSKWVKVGGWKGTTDTHELIEQTHKRYLAGKRSKAEQYAAAATTAVSAAPAASGAKRQMKHAMQ